MCRVTNHKTSHHVLYVAYIQRTMRHLVSTSARTVSVCSILLILCCSPSSSLPFFFLSLLFGAIKMLFACHCLRWWCVCYGTMSRFVRSFGWWCGLCTCNTIGGAAVQIPTSQPTRLFSFMNPLAVEIWLYVMAAYILVSFTLFVMARFSPYEWNSPSSCHHGGGGSGGGGSGVVNGSINDDTDVVENQFSISNSFWFITGTFLRQGSGLNPKVNAINANN